MHNHSISWRRHLMHDHLALAIGRLVKWATKAAPTCGRGSTDWPFAAARWLMACVPATRVNGKAAGSRRISWASGELVSALTGLGVELYSAAGVDPSNVKAIANRQRFPPSVKHKGFTHYQSTLLWVLKTLKIQLLAGGGGWPLAEVILSWNETAVGVLTFFKSRQ